MPMCQNWGGNPCSTCGSDAGRELFECEKSGRRIQSILEKECLRGYMLMHASHLLNTHIGKPFAPKVQLSSEVSSGGEKRCLHGSIQRSMECKNLKAILLESMLHLLVHHATFPEKPASRDNRFLLNALYSSGSNRCTNCRAWSGAKNIGKTVTPTPSRKSRPSKPNKKC